MSILPEHYHQHNDDDELFQATQTASRCDEEFLAAQRAREAAFEASQAATKAHRLAVEAEHLIWKRIEHEQAMKKGLLFPEEIFIDKESDD